MAVDYDPFIETVLRRVQPEFAFVTPDYASDFPAELTWVLVSALVKERKLSVKSAAQAVLDFCERRGEEIPLLLNSPEIPETLLPSKVWH